MKVFYRPEQSPTGNASFSPSAGKPALVVADWLDHGLIKTDDVLDFEPVCEEVLMLAHDRAYVEGILRCNIKNGFGNTSKEVAESLHYTVGSLLAAAEYAIEHNKHTCSPTSGFHHAGYANAEGFCTFNGLMVAARSLKLSGHAKKIGILDLDMHFGNGTESIKQRLRAFYVIHFSAGHEFHSVEDIGKVASRYIDWLEKACFAMRDCDVILYQAGADCHVHDPLGGYLTTKQMRIRDSMVFEAFKGKPLAWNLAGGYQTDAAGTIKPVLDLHRMTATCSREISEGHHDGN